MNTRPYEQGDWQRVEELLSLQPFEYKLPELADPRYISRIAVLNGKEKPVAFGFARVITEAYLLLDHSWGTPGFRWDALRLAHDAARDLTVAQNIDKSVTWIPREIDRSYGRRLESLGWDRQERTGFVYQVGR
jgi:hypothetical protein